MRRRLQELALPTTGSLPAWHWPFERDVVMQTTPREPVVIRIEDVHEAFPDGQLQGTRLVLTQSSYQLRRWLDWLEGAPGVRVIADADSDLLRQRAPEAFSSRGPWSDIDVIDVEDGPSDQTRSPDAAVDTAWRLHVAFENGSPENRLEASRAAIDASPGHVAYYLARASAAMELGALDEAHDALDHALELAPDWEAVHFESGKLWLREEQSEPAAAAFAEAGRLMPAFSAAFGNLGAALGELDRQDEALAALQQALLHDPHGYSVLNNLGVLQREQGHLRNAESTFRDVIAIAPDFVFAYYNLAHTLFLAGRFLDARDAYALAFARDPHKNPRQASRLAIARAAAGDTVGALRDVEWIAATVAAEQWEEFAAEMESTLTALSQLPDVRAASVASVLARVRRYSA